MSVQTRLILPNRPDLKVRTDTHYNKGDAVHLAQLYNLNSPSVVPLPTSPTYSCFVIGFPAPFLPYPGGAYLPTAGVSPPNCPPSGYPKKPQPKTIRPSPVPIAAKPESMKIKQEPKKNDALKSAQDTKIQKLEAVTSEVDFLVNVMDFLQPENGDEQLEAPDCLRDLPCIPTSPSSDEDASLSFDIDEPLDFTDGDALLLSMEVPSDTEDSSDMASVSDENECNSCPSSPSSPRGLAIDCSKCRTSKRLCPAHAIHQLCSVEGCGKQAQSRKLCIKHGGGRRCEVDGCTKSAQSRRRCKSHGGGVRCRVEGCERSSQGKEGRCRAHGGGPKCVISGCTKGAQRFGLCASHGVLRLCRVEQCTKSDRGGGYCQRHGRMAKAGKL